MDAAFSAAAPSALFASSSSAGAAAAARGDRAGLRKARLSWSWSGGGAALRRRAAVAAAAAEGGGAKKGGGVPTTNYVVPLDKMSGITRPLVEILRDLNKRVPDKIINPDHNTIPWYHANRMLSFYAPGWCGEVRDVKYCDSGSVTVVYRVTIRGTDGEAHRSHRTVSLQDGRLRTLCSRRRGGLCKACARFGFACICIIKMRSLGGSECGSPLLYSPSSRRNVVLLGLTALVM
ncbi:hypothetical protein ACMD2_26679 [Ananas comosus]|uniref:Uncharacterized protein n=1 Tax=Ananas comosus TaxID=4615 RepID=A0A199UXU9_ANACO|nr:hypothetical protein ACMD2_26679 [Ananas comosus]